MPIARTSSPPALQGALDDIAAIETTLGVNPQGTAASVAARVTAFESKGVVYRVWNSGTSTWEALGTIPSGTKVIWIDYSGAATVPAERRIGDIVLKATP